MLKLGILAALLLCIAACSQAPTPTPTPKQPMYTAEQVIYNVAAYLKEKTVMSPWRDGVVELDCWWPGDQLFADYDPTNSRWVVRMNDDESYGRWYFYEPVGVGVGISVGVGVGDIGTIEIAAREGVLQLC
jgi:hypothetical protein